MDETVLLVGRRAGQKQRDRNWEFARWKWETELGIPIFEGHHGRFGDSEPYSMAIASNTSAKLAGDWKVALYVGGDFVLRHYRQAREALAVAEATGQLCFAHTHLTLMNEFETERVTGGLTWPPESVEKRHPNTYSGTLAVPRSLWDQVRGFDERFIGWGWEDLAFWASCNALGGGFQRIEGDMYHLWHPRSRDDNEGQPHHAANQVLGERYLAAKNNPGLMREIISERGEQ